MLSNKVREIATQEVVTVGVRDKIFNVMKTMAEKNLGAVVVMEKDGPVGIFTEQDVLKRVIMRRLDTRKSDVKRVMTTCIQAVGEESHIIRALKTMYWGSTRENSGICWSMVKSMSWLESFRCAAYSKWESDCSITLWRVRPSAASWARNN